MVCLAALVRAASFAVSFVSPPAAQQAAPKREAEPLAPLVVHVVDATSREPVGGVAVTCVAMAAVDAEVEKRWSNFQRWFDPIEFDEVSRALGVTKRSDDRGDVTFERQEGELRVIAADDERFGAMRVKPADAGAATLEMKPELHDDLFVVDEHGKAVAGVPVATGWGSGVPDNLPPEMAQHMKSDPFFNRNMDDAWPAMFEGVVPSRAPDGLVRFPHATKWLAPEGGSTQIAELAFPVPTHVEIRLSRAGAGTRRELVVPPLGRVVLTFPGVKQGVAQLRNESKAFWRDFEPARAAIVDGKATFPFVGVGAKAQFRATWAGLSSPVEGKLDGPVHAGDTVEFTAAGAPTIPVFLARIVDEDGQPVSSQELEFCVRRLKADGSDDGENVGITTGADGRVRFTLVEDAPAGGTRTIEVHIPWYAKRSTLHDAGCRLDLTPKFGAGVHELGDVVLHVPGSRKCLRLLPDSELERIYRDACDRKMFSSDAVHDADTCLTEMIERGGDHWRKFIEAEFDGSRSKGEDGDPKGANPTLLTALRRVQRKPDPCVLEVEGGPVIETVFPKDPTIHYRIKNVDEGGETLVLASWEFRTTSCCRIEVRHSDGSLVDGRHDSNLMPGGMWNFETIAPGASQESGIDVADAFHFPAAGDYRARLHHRHGHELFDAAKGPLDGWICSKSEEFTVRVLPQPIRLSPGERKRLRARFDAIDLTKPTILVSDPWTPDAEYTAPAKNPEDDVFRAGWTSVPVLLDVLDDARSSPAACAWALAILADITGLNGRADDDSENTAWGPHRSLWRWPGVRLPDYYSDGGGNDTVTGPKVPDAAQQAELIRRWKETRKSFDVRE